MQAALARVELAASLLARDATTPRARALLHSIASAVADLDRGLVRLASLLGRPRAPRRRRAEPLAPALAALCERLAPALVARGIALEHAPDEASLPAAGLALARASGASAPDAGPPPREGRSASVAPAGDPGAAAIPRADSSTAQRLAIALVRFAAARLAPGGRLRLRAEAADGAPALVLESAGPLPACPADAAAGAALQALVAAERAQFEHTEQLASALRRERLIVRLSAEEESWSTS
jgi:hypothetical protein